MKQFLNLLFLTSCIIFCAYASFFCGTWRMDRTCQVGFNWTHCGDDYMEAWKADTAIHICLNQSTFDAYGSFKNISWDIIRNCRSQCYHTYYGYYNSNGTFNWEVIASNTKKAYALYSNATTKYTQKVVDLHIQCAKHAEQATETKSSKLDKCEINGLFADCYYNLTMNIGNQYDIAEVCAAQGTILEPKVSNSTYP